MHSFLCVDETGCICAGQYKGSLVFNKNLVLNVTLKKKKQLNLIPMQHLFLSLDLNEADSLPLPLYIHSSQKFTQLGSNPISLKCINPHIIRRTWLSQGVLYIKALKYVVKPQQWCTCGTTELWPILTVKQVHELQLWYIQCAALFRLPFLMSPEFQRMYYHASPVGKKTQQLCLDALANTRLCQSKHLPCYHISFPKTQFILLFLHLYFHRITAR